jgi:hypothetical protein
MMTPALQAQAEAEAGRLYQLMREVFRGGLAGTVASVLFLGIGARVVMRISALLNPEAEGAVTENENVVGEITVAGTLELIIFIGILGGLVVGLVWVVVREWLPADPKARALLAALLTLVAGSVAVISADNPDFALLDPPALHLALFVALLFLTGLATAVLDTDLARWLPSSRLADILYGGLAAFGLILAVPFLALVYLDDTNTQAEPPPWVAGLALGLVILVSLVAWARFYASGELAAARLVWLSRLGVSAVALFALLSGVHLVGEIEAIL